MRSTAPRPAATAQQVSMRTRSASAIWLASRSVKFRPRRRICSRFMSSEIKARFGPAGSVKPTAASTERISSRPSLIWPPINNCWAARRLNSRLCAAVATSATSRYACAASAGRPALTRASASPRLRSTSSAPLAGASSRARR